VGIFDRVERAALQAVTWTPVDDRWYRSGAELGGTSDTYPGFPIGPEMALKVSAFFACNSLIAETVASVPCKLYQRTDDKGSKQVARDHRWYKAVRRQPNRRDTPMNFFGDGQMRLGMRGGALAEIVDDGERGELRTLHPDYTTVEVTPSGGYRYRVRDPANPSAEPRILLQNRVLHVRDLSTDGFRGLQRLSLAREAIAVAAAAEGYVGRFFKYDATGRLVITHPTALNDEQREQWRNMMALNAEGWQNRSKYLHLHSGVTATELSKPADSDFITNPRNQMVAEIARFYRVPLFMIGLEEKSTTWGTGIEQQVQGFITFTIRSWAKRWQEALGLALLDEDEQEEFFFEFDFRDLVVGDLLARMEAYQIARGLGMYTPNDLLRKENEEPREDPGGDEYQDTPPGAPPNAASPNRPAPPPASNPNADEPKARAVPLELLTDAGARIATVETRAVERRAPKAQADLAKWQVWTRDYYKAHCLLVGQILKPILAAYDVPEWVSVESSLRIERTAIDALSAGVPSSWLARRQHEVIQLLEETFSAGAAVQRTIV
jgi:HK97 family phage portal protein